MTHNRLVRVLSILACSVIVLFVFPFTSSADNITNSVGANATVSIPAGTTLDVSYRLLQRNKDGKKGCNASPTNPATLTIIAPPEVVVRPASKELTFRNCKQAQTASFTVVSPGGPYYITVTITSGDPSSPGTYNTSGAPFYLLGLAPPDVDAPQVTVNFPAPNGASGWYVSKPVTGTVTASDPNNVTAIDCTGAVVSNVRGLGTTVASADLVVSAEGPNNVSCQATDGLVPPYIGVKPGSASWASVPIDTEAPTVLSDMDRDPDRNDWYNHSVTVSFDGEDNGSGVDFCSDPVTYSGPDQANVMLWGSCSDLAGNQAPQHGVSLSYDATPPVIVSSMSRVPDSNGWYNHGVTISFNGSDASSGLDVCEAPVTYSGPDQANALVMGNCSDRAGNYAHQAASLSYDATPPVVVASLSRGADRNGWYNHSVMLSLSGSDATSGLAVCDPPTTYTGPDGANASISAGCSDLAGNQAAGTASLNYDATPPVVALSMSRGPDRNGWYNHSVTVSVDGADATSGLDVCDDPLEYAGPDRANASISAGCTDLAGNRSPAEATSFNFDATPPLVVASPSRPSDSHGWYNHSVTVSFEGNDATSGADVCDSPIVYSGPDRANAAVSGTCTDLAGNQSAPGGLSLNYDATAPAVVPAWSRGPDRNGWYNHGVTISVEGQDSMSGIDVCDGPVTYAGPDHANATVSSGCRDMAGNRAVQSASLKYDATPPVVGASLSRGADHNGWYNHSVTVTAEGEDNLSGIGDCDDPVSYSGPDGRDASIAAGSADLAGNRAQAAATFDYDATPPVVVASMSRPPDSHGWYNHSVTVTVEGQDTVSGIDVCDQPITYSGPDQANVTLSAGCTDLAGNLSPPQATSLNYDATAPVVVASLDRVPDSNGWYNHGVTVSFEGDDDLSGISVCDDPVIYAGPDQASALVWGACSDVAGNQAQGSASVKYDATPPVVGASLSRGADRNGWYNHSVTVSVSGSDATSGMDDCDDPVSYSGPDGRDASIAAGSADLAGNRAQAAATFDYDATPPVVVASADRSPDKNGWYNHTVTVSVNGNDTVSGMDVCDQPVVYSGPDQANVTVSAGCTDLAGNQSPPQATSLNYDATAPVVVARMDRLPDGNGWYNHSVTVSFDGEDGTSGLDVCEAPVTYAGPDGANATLSGMCMDVAGNQAQGSASLNYDATPPTDIAGVPDRPANFFGGYRGSVTVTFTGNDALSGAAPGSLSCTSRTYAGPPSPLATVSGNCMDPAGNTSADANYSFKFLGSLLLPYVTR